MTDALLPQPSSTQKCVDDPDPTPTLQQQGSKVTATSLQIAQHFGKRHADVIRRIRTLDCSTSFNERNFASVEYVDEKGETRPMYQVTRDGFAFLAMGFTGKEAARWKEAYIVAFNAMEAKLRTVYVEPLLDDKFRNGVPLHMKFKLQEQGLQTLRALEAETSPAARRMLFIQLRRINDAQGIPTERPEDMLGPDAEPLMLLQGGAA